jgi:hypothetical protein
MYYHFLFSIKMVVLVSYLQLFAFSYRCALEMLALQNLSGQKLSLFST